MNRRIRCFWMGPPTALRSLLLYCPDSITTDSCSSRQWCLKLVPLASLPRLSSRLEAGVVANSMQERGAVVATVTSSLALAICFWLILVQVVLRPRRRDRRESDTSRRRPPSPFARTAILAQATATSIHAIIIITTASLNLSNNRFVSAACITCIGVNQSIYGILAWELYMVVHRLKVSGWGS